MEGVGSVAGSDNVDGSEYIVRFNDYLMQHDHQQRLEVALSAADPVGMRACRHLRAGC